MIILRNGFLGCGMCFYSLGHISPVKNGLLFCGRADRRADFLKFRKSGVFLLS
jgi:hypothetical protein